MEESQWPKIIGIILGVLFWGWITYKIISDPKKRKDFWDGPAQGGGGDGGC